jgi:hypothetical protein
MLAILTPYKAPNNGHFEIIPKLSRVRPSLASCGIAGHAWQVPLRNALGVPTTDAYGLTHREVDAPGPSSSRQ